MSQIPRESVPESERWDLGHIFATVDDWERERQALAAELPKIEGLRGTLGQSADQLFTGLSLIDQLEERLNRLFAYAMMQRDEDTRDNGAIQRYEQVMNLAVEAGRVGSFVAPELLTLSDQQLLAFLDAKPELEPFRRTIEQTIRQRPHVRSEEVEQVLAESAEMAQAPDNVFTFFDNADIRFGSITGPDGEQIDITKGRYQRLLEQPNREVRQAAYETLYAPYVAHRNTLGALLTANTQRDKFYARARHYENTLEAALQPDNIPTEVYTNLIETVHRYLPLMHRYVDIRRKVLGIDDPHTYDLYLPLVELPDRNVGYDEAKATVLRALAPLGREYTGALGGGFEGRWIDVQETAGKKSGGYCMGAYGVHPYILLNWSGSIHDMFTLAHEGGHAMHSYFSNADQPHATSQYTIFVAEVASTFNEQLLTAHLLAERDDPQERAVLVNDALESIRTTIFRQTMFAEFELIIHRIVESGEGLTPERMAEEYGRLVGEYHGPNFVVDEQIRLEWTRIPHFYSSFYVYKYATGLIAAMALASKVLSEGEGARDRYLNFLHGGSSKDSLDLLRDAGVDLTTEEPYQAAFATMEDYLDTLEAALESPRP